MCSLGEQVRDWHRGVEAVARGDWSCALRLFSGVTKMPSRMSFNVGCVHLLAGDPEAALRAFDQAVTKDTCMAVGFLQRGVAHFQLERFQEALSDFQLALAQLRGNSVIDYTQLGLCFRLQAWEEMRSQVVPAGKPAPPSTGLPGPGPSQDPMSTGGAAVQDSRDAATVTVQCILTVGLQAPRGAGLASLRALLAEALPAQAQRAQLSYWAPEDGKLWVPIPGEATLQKAWRDAASGPRGLRLRCRGAAGRPVLYQVLAQHDYSAQGPEDLDLRRGALVDVLGEVDEAWLEGHRDGDIGIFPKSFVVPAGGEAPRASGPQQEDWL